MKYELIGLIGDTVVFSWDFKSLTQICKFIEQSDRSLLRFEIYKHTSGCPSIDVDELMKIWTIDKFA